MDDLYHDVFTNNPHNDFTNIGIKDLEEIFLAFFYFKSATVLRVYNLYFY